MATVFFFYFLRDAADAAEFERTVVNDVLPDALAHPTVLDWKLHRAVDWPGASAEYADYVCVVPVSDLAVWSQDASESIAKTHGALAGLVKHIAMTPAVEVGAD